MRFTRLQEKRIAGGDLGHARSVSNVATPGDHVIELPLRAVRMIRIRRLARRDARDLDIERMTVEQIGGSWACGPASDICFPVPLNLPFGERHAISATSRY